MVEDKDGNFIITGFYEYTYQSNKVRQLLLLKVSEKGKFLWAKTYSRGLYDRLSLGLGLRDRCGHQVAANDDTTIPYLLLMQWDNDGAGCGTFDDTLTMKAISRRRSGEDVRRGFAYKLY